MVGRSAAFYGRLAEEADSLGDRIGANEMSAANYVWSAAGMLRSKARRLSDEYMEQHGTTH